MRKTKRIRSEKQSKRASERERESARKPQFLVVVCWKKAPRRKTYKDEVLGGQRGLDRARASPNPFDAENEVNTKRETKYHRKRERIHRSQIRREKTPVFGDRTLERIRSTKKKNI